MKKNRIFVALLLIFVCFAQVAEGRSKEGNGQVKKPWLAGLLSAALPGVGQYYVGGDNVGKGVVFTVVDVGGWVMFFASYVGAVNGIYANIYSNTYKPVTWDAGLGLLGLGIVVGDTLVSVFDAMGDAKSYNAAHGAQSGLPLKQNPTSLTLAPLAFNSLGGHLATGPSLALRF